MAWKIGFTCGQAAGHDARAEQGAFLTTGYTGAYEEEAFFFQFFSSANAVREMAVAAIDDDVAFFQIGQQGFDDPVDHGASLDHDHHSAGSFQAGTQFFDGMRADDRLSGAPAADELVNLAGRAVEYRYREAMACHVEDEVLAHDREAYQADVCFGHC